MPGLASTGDVTRMRYCEMTFIFNIQNEFRAFSFFSLTSQQFATKVIWRRWTSSLIVSSEYARMRFVAIRAACFRGVFQQ